MTRKKRKLPHIILIDILMSHKDNLILLIILLSHLFLERIMLTDEKINNWLKNNQIKIKEDAYDQFPDINNDIIDYHIKKIYPKLLKEDESEKYESKKYTTDRQEVIDYVMRNPSQQPKQLYEKFPDIEKVTIRKYKSVGLSKLKKYAEEEKEKKLKEEKEKAISYLESLENMDKITENQKQTDEKSDKKIPKNDNPLTLSELEAKAYGSKKSKPGASLKTSAKTKQNPDDFDIDKTLAGINKRFDFLDIELKKHFHIIDGILRSSEDIAAIEERLDDLIEEKIEAIIEEKLSQLITKKAGELGMNILGKALGNAMGNINLNTLFGNK